MGYETGASVYIGLVIPIQKLLEQMTTENQKQIYHLMGSGLLKNSTEEGRETLIAVSELELSKDQLITECQNQTVTDLKGQKRSLYQQMLLVPIDTLVRVEVYGGLEEGSVSNSCKLPDLQEAKRLMVEKYQFLVDYDIELIVELSAG